MNNIIHIVHPILFDIECVNWDVDYVRKTYGNPLPLLQHFIERVEATVLIHRHAPSNSIKGVLYDVIHKCYPDWKFLFDERFTQIITTPMGIPFPSRMSADTRNDAKAREGIYWLQRLLFNLLLCQKENPCLPASTSLFHRSCI